MKNIPTKLFLVIGEDVENETDFNDLDHEYVSWCENKINENDVEYVLASTPSMESQWIDVNERLPELKDADEKGYIIGWDKMQRESHKCSFADVCQMRMRFTHWMPLPKSPTN